MIVEGLHSYEIAEVHTEKNYTSMNVEVLGMKRYMQIDTSVSQYRDSRKAEVYEALKTENVSLFNKSAYIGLRPFYSTLVSKLQSMLHV